MNSPSSPCKGAASASNMDPQPGTVNAFEIGSPPLCICRLSPWDPRLEDCQCMLSNDAFSDSGRPSYLPHVVDVLRYTAEPHVILEARTAWSTTSLLHGACGSMAKTAGGCERYSLSSLEAYFLSVRLDPETCGPQHKQCNALRDDGAGEKYAMQDLFHARLGKPGAALSPGSLMA